MRETQLIKSGVVQATTGQTTIVGVPKWADSSIWYLSVVTTAGTSPLTDFKFQYVVPKITAAVVVATSTAGDGTHNEVQTITLTGGPTNGTFTITWPGVSADVSRTTTAISATASGAEVQDALTSALQGTSYARGSIAPITVVRTGAGTTGSPYVHTLTHAGDGVKLTDIDAVTVDGTKLYTYTTDTANDFAGWNGITQIADTTAGVIQVHVGSGITGIADDDTGAIYAVNAPLPEYIAAVITLDRTTGNETYTYSLYATFTG